MSPPDLDDMRSRLSVAECPTDSIKTLTETVDVIYQHDRQQMLPAGKALMTGRQHWSAGRPLTMTTPVTRRRRVRRCTAELNSAAPHSPPQQKPTSM